jgi:hypothetical protein
LEECAQRHGAACEAYISNRPRDLKPKSALVIEFSIAPTRGE